LESNDKRSAFHTLLRNFVSGGMAKTKSVRHVFISPLSAHSSQDMVPVMISLKPHVTSGVAEDRVEPGRLVTNVGTSKDKVRTYV
jgi:hypothetical protein